MKSVKKERFDLKSRKLLVEYIRTALIAVLLLISVLFSEPIAKAVGVGLKICVSSIIPSVFPFMVLSSLLLAYGDFERLTPLKKCFEKFFHIHGVGLSAFLAGIFCGYPLGVKMTIDIYKNRLISKEEAERLIGFCNNTGPAFLIYGIGVGMRGSYSDGVILYLSLVLSAVLVGILFGIGKRASHTSDNLRRPAFDFVSAIKEAGFNTLTVCSFLTFFSVVAGLLFLLVKNEVLLSFILPFLEVGNAANFLSRAPLSRCLSLSLTAFATSFSGISVHMQAESFLVYTDIKRKKYYIMKLLQGFLGAVIAFLFSLFL